MKVKNEKYCLYKGEEYKLGNRGEGLYYIISEDSNKLNAGFYKSYHGTYIKDINKSEIEQVIEYKAYAVYKGEKIRIFADYDDVYYLSGGKEQCERVGLGMTSKGCYGGEVPKDQVKVVIDKEILPDWLW